MSNNQELTEALKKEIWDEIEKLNEKQLAIIDLHARTASRYLNWLQDFLCLFGADEASAALSQVVCIINHLILVTRSCQNSLSDDTIDS